MTPADKIANVTRAVVPAASRESREHRVPSTTLAASAHARTGLGDQTAAHRPLNSIRPVITWSENASTAGLTIAPRAALRGAASPGSRPADRGHLGASGRIAS